jgi:superfamily II DNA or RNA helicase
MASDYSKLDLYEHNQESYQKIKDAFKTKRVASIVHATGTGKSYNALQLALDNPDKKIVYLVPSNGIIEHLKKVIENNPNVDLNRDFKNIEFRTYQSLIRFSRKEIKDLKFDILITDELHHIGAPKWGNRVNELVRTHPDAKIFGMTAYTVRDRGTQYERDMTNSRTNELFSNSVVSKYDICDAMIDGLIPIPIYRSAYINLEQIGQKLETKLNALDPNSKEYKETSDAVKTCIKRIHEAKSIKDVIKTNIKKDGKGIYFCPPFSEKGVNDIDTIIAEAKTWFYDMGLTDDDFVIYKTTILMAQDGVDNRQAFYDDKTIDGKDASHKLRIMFAINQYNEGVHAPNVDFVIMGRGTSSDIVYFEQLGRALSVRGDTKKRFEELEKNSIEELIKIAKEKDIRILPTCEKEEIIQKLTSPVVIDLVNNYNFIKELENNLKDRIKEYSNPVSSHHRVNKINNVAFDIDITNQDIFNTLQQTFTRLYKSPEERWIDNLKLLEKYVKQGGDPNVPESCGLLELPDGEVELISKSNGNYVKSVKIGLWLYNQRCAYQKRTNPDFKTCNKPLTNEQVELLESVGVVFNIHDNQWIDNFRLLEKYVKQGDNPNVTESYGLLELPDGAVELISKSNGNYAKSVKIGNWLSNQRSAYQKRTNPNFKTSNKPLTNEQVELLENLGIFFNINDNQWMDNFRLLEKYVKQGGNLNSIRKSGLLELPNGKVELISKSNGNYDKSVKIGNWLSNQRSAYRKRTDPNIKTSNKPLTNEQIELLENLGIVFNINDKQWMDNFRLLERYVKQSGNFNFRIIMVC